MPQNRDGTAMKRVVITIPAYNEEESIGRIVSGIHEVMKRLSYQYKIQVVDDGSTDKTAEEAKKANTTVIKHPKNYGLAETFRTEMKHAIAWNPDIIVHIDADEQYAPKDIPRLIKEVEAGNDLVLGDRFAGGIESMPWLKKLGNKAFSRAISKITGSRVNDCQTGFRSFSKEVAERVKITSHFTYTQEQIIRAVRQKYKIKEIPAYFHKRSVGKSKLMRGPIQYAVRAWINILRIYRDYDPLKFFGRIGSMFIGLGLIIGIWLVYLFIKTGKVGHIPLTVLTMLLILIGIQIVLFGFLADMRNK